MKVVYRPQRGGLEESMREKKEFDSLKKMLEWLPTQQEQCGNKNAFDIRNLHISYYCYDERVGWETYIVTTDRFYDAKFDRPIAIGFMTFKE